MQYCCCCFNTLRPRQNGRRFADDTFKRIFLNENVRISIKISLKFVPKSPINNFPSLVQIMAGRRSGDKPLSEPRMESLLTHICVTRPQWVNTVALWWLPVCPRLLFVSIRHDIMTYGLYQCWFVVSVVLWHSLEGNYMINAHDIIF